MFMRLTVLALGLLPLQALAMEYPWVYLTPQNDSRDADVSLQDEQRSLYSLGVINEQEAIFEHHLVWRKARITDLLSISAPFCELHFDAVKPLVLTAQEKDIVAEYLRRGGFILFFIDAYPYTQDEFWGVRSWPVMDLIQKDLPASDPDFSAGKASDGFPIFKIHYWTTTAEPIKHELQGNPDTPNRSLLFYRRRLCCFVMGQYSYIQDNEWAPMARPYVPDFSSLLKSYQLMVNIYTFAVLDPFAVGKSQPDPKMPYQGRAPLDPFTDDRYIPNMGIQGRSR